MLWHAYLRRPRLFPRTFGRGVSKGAIDDRYITTHVWVPAVLRGGALSVQHRRAGSFFQGVASRLA